MQVLKAEIGWISVEAVHPGMLVQCNLPRLATFAVTQANY